MWGGWAWRYHSGTPYKEDSRFELKVRYAPVPERVRRIMEEHGLGENFVRKAFERSLELLSSLRGVGARSRRCAGSLMWKAREPSEVVEARSGAVERIEDRIGSALEGEPGFPASRDGYFAVGVGPGSPDLTRALGSAYEVYRGVKWMSGYLDIGGEYRRSLFTSR